MLSKDRADFPATGTAFSSSLTNAFSVSAVPIPGALLLFGSVLGVGGLIGAARRKQHANVSVFG